MVRFHTMAALSVRVRPRWRLVLGFMARRGGAGLAESLPVSSARRRLGIVYALAISAFGGTAQFMVTWLIEVTGSPLAPAWYMTSARLAGGILGVMRDAGKRAG